MILGEPSIVRKWKVNSKWDCACNFWNSVLHDWVRFYRTMIIWAWPVFLCVNSYMLLKLDNVCLLIWSILFALSNVCFFLDNINGKNLCLYLNHINSFIPLFIIVTFPFLNSVTTRRLIIFHKSNLLKATCWKINNIIFF